MEYTKAESQKRIRNKANTIPQESANYHNIMDQNENFQKC